MSRPARKERPIRVAEFFAGIGLVRAGLERAGDFRVVWANDIEAAKAEMYRSHFRDQPDHFHLGDVRDVGCDQFPDVEVATASFPCTNLSLAGNRAGLAGAESSMFWEFARVLALLPEAQRPLPSAVMLENVLGFASSRGGRDLADAITELNRLGYVCDILAVDAAHFVPQSRPRMFIVGTLEEVDAGKEDAFATSSMRPAWVGRFASTHPELKLRSKSLPPLPEKNHVFGESVERLPSSGDAWWTSDRTAAFVESLSSLQRARLLDLIASPRTQWRTAYRRTRDGHATWEIRADELAGCLRTARGGSSKQAVVEAGRGKVRVRWMTPREYARLQGAPDFHLDGHRPNQIYYGFGDAVCVPAVAWIGENYLRPVLQA